MPFSFRLPDSHSPRDTNSRVNVLINRCPRGTTDTTRRKIGLGAVENVQCAAPEVNGGWTCISPSSKLAARHMTDASKPDTRSTAAMLERIRNRRTALGLTGVELAQRAQ